MPDKQRPAGGRKTPIALARAEHGEAPVHLTKAERTVFDEALRRGEDLREELESHVTSYGRWLLGAVFHDDAAAALDDKSDNPVWLELVRRAGGPSLGVSRRLLYVALRLAAHDKRITDQAWRGLDAGRKELLLPLRTDDQLREAAQHVSHFNLSQSSTLHYVSGLLKEGGKPRAARITMPRLVSRVQKLRTSLGGAGVLRRVAELRTATKPTERARAAEEIDRLRDVLAGIAKALRTR